MSKTFPRGIIGHCTFTILNLTYIPFDSTFALQASLEQKLHKNATTLPITPEQKYVHKYLLSLSGTVDLFT